MTRPEFRTAIKPAALTETVDASVHSLDPDVALASFSTMSVVKRQAVHWRLLYDAALGEFCRGGPDAGGGRHLWRERSWFRSEIGLRITLARDVAT